MLHLLRHYRFVLPLLAFPIAVALGFRTPLDILDQDSAPVAAVLAQGVQVGQSCNTCQLDSEVLMTVDCDEEPGFPHEALFVELQNTGSVPFDVEVCFYDFTGARVTCHFRRVAVGETDVSIVDSRNTAGIPSPPIWKAQAFICGGLGVINFLEQTCICDCSGEPRLCNSPECFSQEELIFENDPCPEPPGHTPGAFFGTHRSKVCLTNSCPFDRTVRYWWDYISQGAQHISRSGVTVPANSTVCVCISVGLFDAGDGLTSYSHYDLDDCPGTVDGVGEPCEITAAIVTDVCCDASGNCTNRLPPHLHTLTPCVP